MQMRMKESGQMRQYHQPVDRISRQGKAEQPIMQITESAHNARSTHPVVIASRVLSNKIISRSCYPRMQFAPESF
jgi:hypothetical protein